MDAPHPTSIEVPSRFRAVQHTPWMQGLIRGFIRSAAFLPVWFMRLVAAGVVLPLIVPFTWNNFRGILLNLKRIAPDSSTLRRFLETWATYKNYAYYLIDLLYLSHDRNRIREYTLSVSGAENLWRALDQGRGAVLLTSHLGNWEIGGLALEQMGKKIYMAYAPDSSELFERQRSRMRGEGAVQGIGLKPGGLTSIRLYRLLAAGELIAIQGDRLLFDRGIRVPFFRAIARFPQGPARLALSAGSPIIPIFIPMTGYKRYEIIIEPHLTLNPLARLEENTAKIIEVFERRIRRHRTQWYTFRPFWEEDQQAGWK